MPVRNILIHILVISIAGITPFLSACGQGLWGPHAPDGAIALSSVRSHAGAAAISDIPRLCPR